MRAGSSRWREVSTSQFAHERAGLEYIRELLPDGAPYRAWSNFEFRDRQGRWHEVDLLVLGPRLLHLIELKHYRGEISGTSYRWTRNGRSEESPLLLARRKAQRLAAQLRTAAGTASGAPVEIPYIQECVFLHAADTRCLLDQHDAQDLFGRDDATSRTGLPGISQRLLEPGPGGGGPPVDDSALVALFDQIGFTARRQREVGSWRIVGAPIAEGESWQDWPAERKYAPGQPARIRFAVARPGETAAERSARRRLLEREFELTSRLVHVGILRPEDIVDDDLGVGLVYPQNNDVRRLDLWLTDHAAALSVTQRVGLVRQLAEALLFAHRNELVHRGLCPQAVSVWPGPAGSDPLEPVLKLGDWQLVGLTDPAAAGGQQSRGSATRLFRVLDECGRLAGQDPDDRAREAYLAPEGRWGVAPRRIPVDVFGLGAIAYFVLTGRHPATSGTELADRLSRDGGLDIAADLPETPPALRQLVKLATRPKPDERIVDVPAFLDRLATVDREVATAVDDVVIDPLEAPPDADIGDRFRLRRRLGSGSTAVGLLVTDRENGGAECVLKVARDDVAAERLRGEAAVLRAVSAARHPRLIRLLEPEPLQVGNRVALLLESAGTETLADELRKRSRLSLDLLERWGTDLLEALVGLDAAGIDHRDIKPANLGVRQQRGDRAKHLVLFDFSLSPGAAASIRAGTPPYLDPFLGHGTRTGWDSAAERYAAAVTLFEMATGTAPEYAAGAAPDAVRDEATVEPGQFDAAVADRLVPLFRRALRRDARERFDTATQMLTAWRAAFATTPPSRPDDADERAERARPETSLTAAGLSARAISALEPFGVQTVGELAALDPGRLSQMRGVADPTRREVRSRAKQWRVKFGAMVGRPQPVPAAGGPADPLQDPVATAQLLVDAIPARQHRQREVARRLLGLNGDVGVDVFGTLEELAAGCGLGGSPQMSIAQQKLLTEWAKKADAATRLDTVLDRVVEVLADLGGASWSDMLVTTLAGTGGDPARRRVVAGLVRLSLDRGEQKARGADEDPPVVRRRQARDHRLLLAALPTPPGAAAALLDAALALAAEADRLVDEKASGSQPVIDVSLAAERLAGRWPREVPRPEPARLVRLAATLSERAAASWRGELYARDLPPATAVRLAFHGVASSIRFTPEDVRQRVLARFPDLADILARPGLDEAVRAAGLGLDWDGEAYVAKSVHAATSFASRTTPTRVALDTASSAAARSHEDAELAASVGARSFLALGVRARAVDRVRQLLVGRFDAREVDVTALLLARLRAEAVAAGVPWEAVRAADAAEPGSQPARGLAALVGRAIPAVRSAIEAAMAAAEPGTRPVLVVEAAPLARYGYVDLLAELADITLRRTQAVWLLLPLDGSETATLDGVPVPLSYAPQFLRLGRDWMPAPAPEEATR